MYTLVSPSYRCFISNLALIGQAVSKKIFEYYGNTPGIHVSCPGVEADQPLGYSFFQNYKSSVYLRISFNFFTSNDILTIFHIQMHGHPC